MSAVGLPARIVYAVAAVPLGAAAGFYTSMEVLPHFAEGHPGLDPARDGSGIFHAALFAGLASALTLGLLALTLPWIRHRKRRGRGWRVAVSGVAVLVLSVVFADEGYGLVSDLVFVAWLTYTLAFTFVRYGVIDQHRRPTAPKEDY